MNTTENNKLIAEFMGYPYFLSDSGVDSWGDDEFHQSWDWLMPVVEKINETGRFEVNIGYGRCYITDGEDELTLSMVENQTQYAVYRAVVEFIKWYNENK